MSHTSMHFGPIPEDTQQMLDCLTEAVNGALERKRKLGQYAVFWEDGQVVLIGEDAPNSEAPGIREVGSKNEKQ